MNSKSTDISKQAAVLAVTAKCLEALAPLSFEDRKRVLMSLTIYTLDEDSPDDRRFMGALLGNVAKEMGGKL